MNLVEIPAGWFWMGRDDGVAAERPRHHVFTDGFAIARHPVTNAVYARFLQATGAPPPPCWGEPHLADPRQPVVGVSWHDAVAFCAWWSERVERLHRLPTEAEWEKAARGGVEDARYPWGDTPPALAFPGVTPPLAGPPPVGTGPANGYGLTDCSGVVHEWCLDWHADGYPAAPARNPGGPPAGRRRVSRGGAWRHQVPWSPVAHRSSLPPHLRYADYGFRLVRPG